MAVAPFSEIPPQFQTTRRRLAWWYTGVTAVLLLLFASGFYLYVRGTLIERVDDTLSHVAEVVERSLVLEPALPSPNWTGYQVNVEASFRNPPEAVEDDRIDLEWFNPTGELLWSTWSEVLTIPIHLDAGGETVEISPDVWLRQLTDRLEVNGEVLGYLRISHPWFEVTKPTRQLGIDLAGGISLMVGLVAAIGWFLSRLAIEPIRASYQQLKQFTADASHELRNPIALIQTNVQVALADPTPDLQEQRQQLEVIERLTQRLGRLVDDLLFLARQDSGMVQTQFQPCPLDAVLMAVVEEQGAIAAAKSLQLTLDLGSERQAELPGSEPFTLLGDYDQLVRLFTNLVGNSIVYTPPGGSISIHLIHTQRQGLSELQVLVQDSGVGVPADALPRLFDRFYRADPSRQRDPTPSSGSSTGTGLGLAIAQAIAQNHQGTIRVESQPQVGTTFTVTFPGFKTEVSLPSETAKSV
ncbi:sensor histidine kinase [Synechococcales cyanobacterium C]|uniref:histidine kinase n=1 Tax=Petrachloros mirabilis ULC683 TaxID=2781853 RepID=A0A8K2A0J9_9CYAN|nr:HAMP domain-containing sensor histidine kinase [Petrachloros mirabilis]NCJ07542.1 sensor histidine kinase [Petrachloros mirabilis ULC683]